MKKKKSPMRAVCGRAEKTRAALLETRMDRCGFASSEKLKKKHNSRMIKCLLTELRRNGRENIWPSVRRYGS